MWHPLTGWESVSLGWLLAVLAFTSLVLMVRLHSLARGLRNASAPMGMTSLARTMSNSESRDILESWDRRGRESARRHLVIDSCLIPVFFTALAALGLLASRWFASRGHLMWRDAAMILTWGTWLAGALDFAENTTLLRMVHAYPIVPETLTRFSGWLSRCKFLLVLLAVAVCATAFASIWTRA